MISMRDSELMDTEMLDVFWSPLEPSTRRHFAQQASSRSLSPPGRTLMLDAITENDEPKASPAMNGKAEKAGRREAHNRAVIKRRHLSLTQFMLNFARGMAAAFGASTSCRPGTIGRSAYFDDFDLGDLKTSRSMLPAILPSRSRIRLFFSRMKHNHVPLSSEQLPLVDVHGLPGPPPVPE